MKDRFQGRRDVGSDIAAIDDDSITHETMGLLGGEQMNSLPEFMKRGEGLGRIGAGKDQRRFVVEWTQAGIEVVAIRIDQLQGRDGNPHFRHCGGEFCHAAARAAVAVAAVGCQSRSPWPSR